MTLNKMILGISILTVLISTGIVSATTTDQYGNVVCTDGNDLRTYLNNVTRSNTTIFLRAGTYNIDGKIALTGNNITIIGRGKYSTILNFTNTSDHGLEINGSNITIKNLQVTRNSNYTQTGVAILFFRGGGEVNDCIIKHFMQGIYIREDSWSKKISSCEITGCDNGIVLRNSEANNITIQNSFLHHNYSYGIHVRYNENRGYWGPYAVRIRDNLLEDNGLSAIRIETSGLISISGNYFGGNDWRTTSQGNEDGSNDAEIYIVNVGAPVANITIEENYFDLTYSKAFDQRSVVCNGEKNSDYTNFRYKKRYRTSGTVSNIISRQNSWRGFILIGSSYFPDFSTSFHD